MENQERSYAYGWCLIIPFVGCKSLSCYAKNQEPSLDAPHDSHSTKPMIKQGLVSLTYITRLRILCIFVKDELARRNLMLRNYYSLSCYVKKRSSMHVFEGNTIIHLMLKSLS